MSQLEKCIQTVSEKGCEASVDDLLYLLNLRGDDILTLFKCADKVRQDHMGKAIYVRGMVTISTHCSDSCTFCSLRKENRTHQRYRMGTGEIANIVHQAMHFGCTTIILQTGCDPDLSCGHLCEIIDRIKIFPGMGIGLACGDRKPGEFKFLRQYGADRFYLRFETADQRTFENHLAAEKWEDRINSLSAARANDMQLSSGFLVGWPNSTTMMIAQDILYTSKWKFDEIWCDPFIAQEDTPLASKPMLEDRQVYFKTISILRLLNPSAHISSSPAFNAVLKYGADRCLLTGANTYIINMTPDRYDCPGNIYSTFVNKKDVTAADTKELLGRVLKLNRNVGKDSGPSFRPDWVKAHPEDYE